MIYMPPISHLFYAYYLPDACISAYLFVSLFLYFSALSIDAKLYRSGRSWTIRKRYSEFCRLHEALMAEGVVAPILLPKLPSKRWFRWVRWSNRWVFIGTYPSYVPRSVHNYYHDDICIYFISDLKSERRRSGGSSCKSTFAH
jgi:hypothetical protein